MAQKRTSESEKSGSLNGEAIDNVLKIAEIEAAQKAKRSVAEKIAALIARFCGSMTFVWVHVVWFGVWIIANTMTDTPFDPFPFTFLTLVVSLEAIFLSTFILISQNHETRLTERRNHLDLQINMLAEQESTKTLELLQLVAKKVGVHIDDEETATLLEPVEPDKIIDQILTATEETNRKDQRLDPESPPPRQKDPK